MSTSYTEKFNVLEVFEQNPYQKIMMGARIDNPDDVVVINVFKKGPHIAPDFLEKAQNSLHNIIHSEDTLQEQILVTDYQEGISLHNYLDGFGSNLDKRIALANDYMQKTFAYKNFSNYFLGIFLDDNQIILQDDTLLMNELIIVDEQIEQRHDFSKVVEKIASTLDLIFLGGKNAEMTSEEKERIDAFLNSLNINSAVYKNLEDVYSAFKKTFILGESIKDETPAAPPIIPVVDMDTPDTQPSETETPVAEPPIEESIEIIEDKPEEEIEPSHDKEIELDGLEVVNDIFDDDDEPEKRSNSSAIAMILIAVAAIAAFFVFANPFAKEELKIPNASFIRQEVDGDVHFKNTSQAFGNGNEIVLSEWTVYATTSSGEKKLKSSNDTNLVLTIKNSGNYRVELKVQDKLEQWSDPASEAFTYSVDILSDVEDENSNTTNPQEKLNKYDIELNGSGTEKVTDLYRSGSESIKMDLTAENGTITMKDLNMSDHSIVSMWLLSDGTSPVTIEMRGFKDGQMVFSKTLKHTPRAANIWEMVESKVDGSGANTLQLIFSGDSTIWVDDIDISTYK